MDRVHSEGSHSTHETQHTAPFTCITRPRHGATSPIDPLRCRRRRRRDGRARHCRGQGTPGSDQHSHAAAADDAVGFNHDHDDTDDEHDHGAFICRGIPICPRVDDAHHIDAHHHHVSAHHHDHPPRRALGRHVAMSIPTAGS